jgi:Transposase DDE domain
MRAESILRRVLGEMGADIHRARVGAVMAAVIALIHGGEVGLAALGRAISGRSHKHGIKRIDRLLGNQALAEELELIYGAITRYALRSVRQPVILLDWTRVRNEMCALTAAVPVEGRALTIYSITCPLSDWTKRTVENEFLRKLRTFLPTSCSKPVLVADAGFRAPWIRKARALGFEFVTRIRSRTRVRRCGERYWQHWKALFPLKGKAPQALGTFEVARARPVEVHLVAVDHRSRRARKPRVRQRAVRALRAIKANCEPWLLATSLELPPKQIVGLYAKRMQIELTFRDLKSHRFGWAFEDARSRSLPRMAIQILLATLASLVAMLFGVAAEQANLHRQYQANTTRARRVLSLVSLGRAVFRTADPRLRSAVPTLTIVGIP